MLGARTPVLVPEERSGLRVGTVEQIDVAAGHGDYSARR